MGMKQKKFKMTLLKQTEIFKIAVFQIANSYNFLWKFYGLVLGLVGLIDAKGIDWCSSTYMVVRLSDTRIKTGK